MNTLIHADIFFFVSTIALILITIVVVIALIYLIKILRDLSSVSKKVKEEGIEIIDDVKDFRHTVKQNGFQLKLLSTFMGRLFRKRKNSKKNQSLDNSDNS